MNAPRVGPTRGSVVALALACTGCLQTGCGGDDAPGEETTHVQIVRTATATPTPDTRVTIHRSKPMRRCR